MRTHRRVARLVLVVVLLSGCGSTVPQAAMGTSVSADSGLTAPAPVADDPVVAPVDGVAPATAEGVSGAGAGQRPSLQPGPVHAQPSAQPAIASAGGSSPRQAVAAAVTGPLSIGLLNVSSTGQAVDAIGAETENTTDTQAVSRAFVRHYNSQGGVAGRRLEVVEYTLNPSSATYETELAAACAKFTQDAKVPIVLSHPGAIFSESYENCLSKAGVINLEMQIGAPDEAALQRYPRLYTLAVPTVDRRMTAVLRGLLQGRVLTPRSKIGVIVENCPQDLRAFERTVVPLARELGLQIVDSRTVDCLRGFSEAGAFQAQVQAAIWECHSHPFCFSAAQA